MYEAINGQRRVLAADDWAFSSRKSLEELTPNDTKTTVVHLQ